MFTPREQDQLQKNVFVPIIEKQDICPSFNPVNIT